MKSVAFRAVCSGTLILLFSSAVLANNNQFLPGDAFFSTTLTQDFLEELTATKTGEREFGYDSLGGYSFAFCGYAGYAVAKIPAVDDTFVKNLARVYQHHRGYVGRELREETINGKTELWETNGIGVLFYSVDFEFPRYDLGLRYNENWVAETLKFGHRKEYIRLCCLVSNPRAVGNSWRDAETIPGLQAELPDIELKVVPRTDEPVVIRSAVKAFVLGSHTPTEIFERKRDDYLTVYVVDSQGITEMKFKEGTWESEKWLGSQ